MNQKFYILCNLQLLLKGVNLLGYWELSSQDEINPWSCGKHSQSCSSGSPGDPPSNELLSSNTKLQEQSFMVVCDVTSENKEVIKQLEDAHVSVQHRSRTKKDSSDEVLRQQMRKVVDTSAQPGRIVLISGGKQLNLNIHLSLVSRMGGIPLGNFVYSISILKVTATSLQTSTVSVSQNCGRSSWSIMLLLKRRSRSLQLMLSLSRRSWKKERRQRRRKKGIGRRRRKEKKRRRRRHNQKLVLPANLGTHWPRDPLMLQTKKRNPKRKKVKKKLYPKKQKKKQQKSPWNWGGAQDWPLPSGTPLSSQSCKRCSWEPWTRPPSLSASPAISPQLEKSWRALLSVSWKLTARRGLQGVTFFTRFSSVGLLSLIWWRSVCWRSWWRRQWTWLRSFPTFGIWWQRFSVPASTALLFHLLPSRILLIFFPPMKWSIPWFFTEFLATLAALHLTPVSKWVSDS